ncbi:MAG: PrgI family mobile element protein [Patescibacteria group bacterium]
MQYELPRYIEEEAKILGPLSLKQFMIAFAGIIISALFFFFFQAWLAMTLSLILMSGIVFLMFGKIEGRSATTVVLGMIKYVWLPKVFVWQKPALKSKQIYVETLRKQEPKPTEPEPEAPKIVSEEEIKELARQLDQREPEPELEPEIKDQT